MFIFFGCSISKFADDVGEFEGVYRGIGPEANAVGQKGDIGVSLKHSTPGFVHFSGLYISCLHGAMTGGSLPTMSMIGVCASGVVIYSVVFCDRQLYIHILCVNILYS